MGIALWLIIIGLAIHRRIRRGGTDGDANTSETLP